MKPRAHAEHTTVLIVGAGPVGLFLGLALQRLGVACTLIDRRRTASRQSRAIGIHPPSLAYFDRLGLAGDFEREGRRVVKGVALADGRRLGEITFSDLVSSHPFIITLPQYRTEQLLRAALSQTDAQLFWGVTPVRMSQNERSVTAAFEDRNGEETTITAAYLVGCDGRNSWVRQCAGIRFRGGAYPDRYVMSDYPDHLPEPGTAYIYVSAKGLVEALPLPQGGRRWVCRLETDTEPVSTARFAETIRDRTGEQLPPHPKPEFTTFGIQRYLAEQFVQRRVILAGDAAHVMSPMGGQGLNIGWMDAWDLAHVMAGQEDFDGHEQVARRRAAMGIRRAHHNTVLGRPSPAPFLKNAFIRTMLNTPLRKHWLHRFTMQKLPQLHEPRNAPGPPPPPPSQTQ